MCVADMLFLGGDVTCLIGVAEDGLLLMGPRAVSHPHRDRKGFLQVGANHAVRDLDSLGTIELKDLVAVVSVVRGQPDSPVGRGAGRRQKLHSARTGSFIKSGQSQTINGGMEVNWTIIISVEPLFTTKRVQRFLRVRVTITTFPNMVGFQFNTGLDGCDWLITCLQVHAGEKAKATCAGLIFNPFAKS